MTRMLIVLSGMASLSFMHDIPLAGRLHPLPGAVGMVGRLQIHGFTDFHPLPGVVGVGRIAPPTTVSHPGQVSPAAKKPAAKQAAKTVTGPARNQGSTITINMNVVPEMMQFTKTAFTVKAGQKVIIEFENGDNMQHNMVIIKPGTTEKVGAAADELARDPKGALKNYVPEVPEVLHASKLLDPQANFTLQFTAPDLAGDYPYICTFPGHWRMMKGVMTVVK